MRHRFATVLIGGLAALAAVPAAAQCPAFLCYLDLAQGSFVCPNGAVYTDIESAPIVIGPENGGCDANFWKAMKVQVNLPPECSGITVWVEYAGQPEGWTVDIGDSATNNGFGGDAGSIPIGQNAEAQILDNNLAVFSAASAPPVEQLTVQQLALEDGAIKFVVKDQFVSWGQPSGNLSTPNLNQLFFLDPGNSDRTLYVGINRVVSGGDRNGCGARHAMIFTQ